MKKNNNLISVLSIAFFALGLCLLYIFSEYRSNIGLLCLVAFGQLMFLYFLVKAILVKITSIIEEKDEKNNEISKIGKGIYSVSKKGEANLVNKIDELISTLEKSIENNVRLSNEIIENNKLFSKLEIKKAQENMVRMVNSNDRIAKQIVQVGGDNKVICKEIIIALNDISKALEEDKIHQNDKVEVSNIRKMPGV